MSVYHTTGLLGGGGEGGDSTISVRTCILSTELISGVFVAYKIPDIIIMILHVYVLLQALPHLCTTVQGPCMTWDAGCVLRAVHMSHWVLYVQLLLPDFT